MLLNTVLMCLALNVYHETRGEPMSEGYAVSHVVLNRVKHDRWPDDVCSVVKQDYKKGSEKCQFSWYCDGKPDKPYEGKAWALSQLIAHDVLDGTVPDNTNGATHYHAHYVNPWWAKELIKTVSLKTHIYYK